MNWVARSLASWIFAFSAFGGGPDYDAFSDRSGRILDDEQHVPAFQAMVRDTAQLEAIYADAMKGDPRAARVFEELEKVYFPIVGREVAEREGRKACLLPAYRELSGSCIPNWGGLDFLPKDTPMGVRLRNAVADAYAARARELGIENRAILSAVNALVAVGVVSAAVRSAPVGVSPLKLTTGESSSQGARTVVERRATTPVRAAGMESGTPAPKVHMGQQGKHIPGHNNFQPGRSVLRADPHELAKRAGTGTPLNQAPRGQPGFRERVQLNDVIGDFVKDGVATPTRNAIIHYGKDGIHIVPAAP